MPIGWEADFKDPRLIMKQPRSLFPLTCFEHMTNDTAKKVANMIMTILSEFILQFHVAFRLLPSMQPLLTFSQNSSWE